MKKVLIALLVFAAVTASIFYAMKTIYSTDSYQAESSTDIYNRR